MRLENLLDLPDRDIEKLIEAGSIDDDVGDISSFANPEEQAKFNIEDVIPFLDSVANRLPGIKEKNINMTWDVSEGREGFWVYKNFPGPSDYPFIEKVHIVFHIVPNIWEYENADTESDRPSSLTQLAPSLTILLSEGRSTGDLVGLGITNIYYDRYKKALVETTEVNYAPPTMQRKRRR